jgi:hypothetical protein
LENNEGRGKSDKLELCLQQNLYSFASQKKSHIGHPQENILFFIPGPKIFGQANILLAIGFVKFTQTEKKSYSTTQRYDLYRFRRF